MVFHLALNRLTGRLSSVGRRLQRNQFFSDTSLHGFGHFVKAKNKGRAIFWLIVPTIAILYCGYQVCMETIRLVKNDHQVTSLGLGQREDIRLLPKIELCYSHWLFYIDFEKAYKMNLTKEEIFVLMSHMEDKFNEHQCITSCENLDLAATCVYKKFKLKQNYTVFHNLIDQLIYDPGYTTVSVTGEDEFVIIPPNGFAQLGKTGHTSYCKEIVSKYFVAPNVEIYGSILEPILVHKSTYLNVLKDNFYNFTSEEKAHFNRIISGNIGTLVIDGEMIFIIPSNVEHVNAHLKSSIITYTKPIDTNLRCAPELDHYDFPARSASEEYNIPENYNSVPLCTGCQTLTYQKIDYHEETGPGQSRFVRNQSTKDWKPYYDDSSSIRCAEHSLQAGNSFDAWFVRKHDSSWTNATRKYLALIFTFDDPRTWMLTEFKPEVTLADAFASIGGTLGIWTGASILSFVHIIDYFFSIIPYKRIFKFLRQKVKIKVTVVKVHRM